MEVFYYLPWTLQKIVLSYQPKDDLHIELQKKIIVDILETNLDEEVYHIDEKNIYISSHNLEREIFELFPFDNDNNRIGFSHFYYIIRVVPIINFLLYKCVDEGILDSFRIYTNEIICQVRSLVGARLLMYYLEDHYNEIRYDPEARFEIYLNDNRILIVEVI